MYCSVMFYVLAETCPAQCVTWTTSRLFLGKCGSLNIAKQEPGYEASIIVTTGAIIMHVASMCVNAYISP